jgi:hypothetical protein
VFVAPPAPTVIAYEAPEAKDVVDASNPPAPPPPALLDPDGAVPPPPPPATAKYDALYSKEVTGCHPAVT